MTTLSVEWRADMPDNCEAIECGVSHIDDNESVVTRMNVDQYAKLPIVEYDGWRISGRGQVSSSLCGVPVDSFRSDDVNEHGYEDRVWRYHNCKVQECPECYRVWASRAAKKAATYLCGGISEFEMTAYHSCLSVDDGFSGSREYWVKTIDMFLHSLHDWTKGNLGYCMTIHPYRLRCRNWDAKHQDYYDTHGDYDVNPKEKCPICHMINYAWLPGLHFHLISNFYVTDFARAKALRAKVGLRYANLSQDKRKRFLGLAKSSGWVEISKGLWMDQLSGEKHPEPAGYLSCYMDVFRVLRYELTHCESRPGKHPLKYAGAFRRGTYRVTETKSHWSPMVTARDSQFFKEEARPYGRHQMAIRRDPADRESTMLAVNVAGRPIVLKHRIIDEVDVELLGRWDMAFVPNSAPRFRRFPRERPVPPEPESPTLRAYRKLLQASKELENRVMGKVPFCDQ